MIARRLFVPGLASVAVVLALHASLTARQPQSVAAAMRGGTPAGAAAQAQQQARFRALPDAKAVETWHRYFTKSPHPATSARTKLVKSAPRR